MIVATIAMSIFLTEIGLVGLWIMAPRQPYNFKVIYVNPMDSDSLIVPAL